MPDGPGYRIVFAHLRRDWRLIGVERSRVAPGAPADLRLIDEVAPANLASWYLRHFTCDASAICDPAADEALLRRPDAARAGRAPWRTSPRPTASYRPWPFIALTPPVRWSLVSPRLTGFRPNPFARHPAVNLIAERPEARSTRGPFRRMADRLPVGRDPASVRQRIEAMERCSSAPSRFRAQPRVRPRRHLDLIPVVGNVVTAAMGTWIVWEARNLGMSKWHLARMAGNVGFDFLLGAIP